MKGRHERSDRLEPILRLFCAQWSDDFMAKSRRLVTYGLKTSSVRPSRRPRALVMHPPDVHGSDEAITGAPSA